MDFNGTTKGDTQGLTSNGVQTAASEVIVLIFLQFLLQQQNPRFLKVYGPLGVVHMKWTYLGSCLNTGTVMKVHRVPFTQMNRLFTHGHRV